MFQNTGRVCGARYRDSYALRSSPLVCAVDTLMMMVKFVWMLLLRCPFRVAARHVWYDRFEVEDVLVQNSLEFYLEFYGWTLRPEIAAFLAAVLQTGVSDHAAESNQEVGGQTPMQTFLMSGALNSGPAALDYGISAKVRINAIDDEHDNAATELGEPSGSLHEDEDIANIPLHFMETLEDPDDCLTGPGSSSRAPGNMLLHGNDNLEAGDISALTESSPLTGPNEHSQVYPGSTIDPVWRLTMAGFLLGALPQAVKIFGMRGIIFTQILVGSQVVSFVVPELFRVISGTAGAVNLHPMPSVVFAKETFMSLQRAILLVTATSSAFGCWIMLEPFVFLPIFALPEGDLRFLVYANLTLIAPLVTAGLYTGRGAFAQLAIRESFLKTVTPRQVSAVYKGGKQKFVTTLSGLLDVQTPYADEIATICILYLFTVLITLALMMYSNAWRISHLHWISVTLCFFISPMTTPTIVYALFRILFVGSLSKYPRELFGLKERTSELILGAFIGVHMLGAVSRYVLWYDPTTTHKPQWADLLG